jgi:2-hydroxy-dATP diphosphatase / coenzyme A diphosphatase
MSAYVKFQATSTDALKSPERPYHTYHDHQWHGLAIRTHSFLTGREAEGVKPIYGMTSCASFLSDLHATQTDAFIVCAASTTRILWIRAILIRTAQIGYARHPDFELYAPGQMNQDVRVANAMVKEESLRKACRDEGIEQDWVTPRGTQGPTTKVRNAWSRL